MKLFNGVFSYVLPDVNSAIVVSATVNGGSPITPDTNGNINLTTGSGSVSTVSVANVNGISGTVANATTTPVITLALGAITPTSIGASTTATTQSVNDNSTKLATTAYADAKVENNLTTSTTVAPSKAAVIAALPIAANPSNLIGLTPNNGVASTFQRSDATHAINQAIAPTWTGQHNFISTSITSPMVVTGGVSGSDLVQWVRNLGITQSYGWSIGTRLLLKDLTTGSKIVLSAGQESSISSIAPGMDSTGTAAGVSGRFRGLNGSGADQAGGDLIISAGRGTGAGTAGRIIFEGNVASTTGSSLSSPVTALIVNGANVTIAGQLTIPNGTVSTSAVNLAQLQSYTSKDVNLSKTANYTVLTTDFGQNGTVTLFVDATSGAVTVTLPSSSAMVGNTINVIKTDGTANTVTVKGDGSTNINQANTYLLSAQNSNVTIKSNSTQYWIF